jgi:ectoine hydroxylase-related dioxygenase (phytanoyl-CoA dioxygenase family)
VYHQENKIALENQGYCVCSDLYSRVQVHDLHLLLDESLREFQLKSAPVFAIRKVLDEIPEIRPLVFNQNLRELLTEIAPNHILTKSIYFDKPVGSNWFVAYHQDLSISVDKKHELEGYKNWTHKQGIIGVQPPLHILNNTLTVRIHLDDTDSSNGALKVIPKSHLDGVTRIDTKTMNISNQTICEVPSGGIMIMKPLLYHASNRSENGNRRRVIHLEFCDQELAKPILWSEAYNWKEKFHL